MRLGLGCVFVVACTSTTESDGGDGATADFAASDSGAPPYAEPPPGYTGQACESDTQAVLSATFSPLPIGSTGTYAVELTEEAALAVACVNDASSDDILFVESQDVATKHEIRMAGMAGGASYTCSVAPLCPYAQGRVTQVSVSAPPIPDGVGHFEVSEGSADAMWGAWTLGPMAASTYNVDTWLVVWGPQGRMRWWWPLPEGVGTPVEVLWNPETRQMEWGGGGSVYGRPHSVDLFDGVQYAWAPEGWENERFHHDGKRVEDGRWISLMDRDNTTTEPGGLTWLGFGIRMHDQDTGEISWDFDSQTLVDAGALHELDSFDVPYGDDPYHANWVDMRTTPDGNQVFISTCFSRQLLAVDEATQQPLWTLQRDAGWTVLDETGAPLTQDDLPQCQHGLEVDSDGKTFLVYDNGWERGESRASVWVIDGETKTAQRTWNWTEDGWFRQFVGDIDWLPNGHVWITQAGPGGLLQELVEVVPDTGAVVGRLTISSNPLRTYRTERYDGCDIFSSATQCDAVGQRLTEIGGLLGVSLP